MESLRIRHVAVVYSASVLLTDEEADVDEILEATASTLATLHSQLRFLDPTWLILNGRLEIVAQVTVPAPTGLRRFVRNLTGRSVRPVMVYRVAREVTGWLDPDSDVFYHVPGGLR